MDPNEKISCLSCGWKGKLRDCKKHYDEGDTTYSCPRCGAILM